MSIAFLITTIVTIAIALTSYWVSYRNSLRLSQRQEQLNRLNRQLSELYGPLLALAEAARIAWTAFRGKYRADSISFFDEQNPPTKDELDAFRLWMKEVFMPRNRKLYDLVVSKADLLIEEEMPSALLVLCAHVASYEVVLHQWEKGDFSQDRPLVDFPGDIYNYANHSFRLLKSQQLRLLGLNPYERALEGT